MLILSKIIKTVATRCQILRLKFTKFDLAPPQTPLGELTALPRGPSERLGRNTPPQTPPRRRLRHEPTEPPLVTGLDGSNRLLIYLLISFMF